MSTFFFWLQRERGNLLSGPVWSLVSYQRLFLSRKTVLYFVFIDPLGVCISAELRVRNFAGTEAKAGVARTKPILCRPRLALYTAACMVQMVRVRHLTVKVPFLLALGGFSTAAI